MGVDHRQRHLGLMNTVKGAQIPITEEMTDFIKNWLAQHIKNTDFTYKGLLPEVHPIPNPFKWNAFFAVYYPEMDEEHKVLFSCLAEVEQSPADDALLASCLKSYEDHFVKETDLLAQSATYPKEELYQHINKHNTFLVAMRGRPPPSARNGSTLQRTGSPSISPTPISGTRTRCPIPWLTPMSGTSPSKCSTRDSMMSTSSSLTSCSSSRSVVSLATPMPTS